MRRILSWSNELTRVVLRPFRAGETYAVKEEQLMMQICQSHDDLRPTLKTYLIDTTA
jgi:hypothetical protein